MKKTDHVGSDGGGEVNGVVVGGGDEFRENETSSKTFFGILKEDRSCDQYRIDYDRYI